MFDKTPFSDFDSLRSAFAEGLADILAQRSLGGFILVCANAAFDEQVRAATWDGVAALHAELAEAFRGALRAGRPLAAVEEDLLVFFKMDAVGLDHLAPVTLRQEGPWEVQFNHLRAFRPQRMSSKKAPALRVPFNPDGFHFNRPFMLKEQLWEGVLGERQVSVYYNKYPFSDFHTLLVPEREAGLPQFLEHEWHEYLWELCAALAQGLPGVGFGYNSSGAYASVNHLHFQMFVRPSMLPVEAADWSHNGGARPYPAHCQRFDDAVSAWEALEALHRAGTPYNLLYLPGRLLLFPRRPQGSVEPPPWSSGFTWSEMGGAILAANRDDFNALSDAEIRAHLHQN